MSGTLQHRRRLDLCIPSHRGGEANLKRGQFVQSRYVKCIATRQSIASQSQHPLGGLCRVTIPSNQRTRRLLLKRNEFLQNLPEQFVVLWEEVVLNRVDPTV